MNKISGRVDLKRLIAVLLAFFIILTPLSPVFAQEVLPPADVSAPLAAPADPTGNTEPDNGSDPSVEAQMIKPGNEKSKDTASPDTKDKTPKDKKAKETETTPESNSLAAAPADASSPNIATAIVKKISNIDENSGAYIYEYPITVPPGRNGLQPDLKLKYNSQDNQDVNIVGYGWSFDIPYIERLNKKGTDQLYSQNYFNSSLSGELIDLGSGSFGSKIDNGEFLNYSFSGNVWTVKDKSGTAYKFGTNAAERQDDPNDSAKIYKWMLQEVRDTNNNYVKYTYYKDAGQIYPSTILYTGNGSTDGIFAVNFVRSSRTDNIKSYRTAFLVSSNYKITEINTTVNGTWYKKYALAYTTGDNGLRSMLSGITESGRDDSLNTTTLPATTFTYQTSTPGWDLNNNTWYAPGRLTENNNILDVNGDSYVDMMIRYWEASANSWAEETHTNAFNNTWSFNSNLTSPIPFLKNEYRRGYYGSYDQGVRLVDLNGDQYPDIIQGKDQATGAGTYKAYLNNSATGWTLSSGWAPAIGMTQGGNGGFGTYNEDYGGRVLDLNGDGRGDLSLQNGNTQTTQLNNGSGFSSAVSTWNTPQLWDYILSREADVNNDGLPDMMYSWFDNFYQQVLDTAYLNNGLGSWISDTSLKTPIRFGNNNDNGVKFIDLNGDGLVDTINNDNPMNVERHAYLNTGKGWTLRDSWNFPTAVSSGLSYGAVYAGDFNQDGLVDFIQPHGWGLAEVWLHRGVEPDLLSRITYPTGGYTDLTYQKTAKYRDASNNILNPKFPINLTTVKTITNNTGVGLTSTLNYSYEGGKYFFNNAFDRRLSGFAKIKQTDSVGNKTTYYYHQGDTSDSTQGEYNDDQWKIGKAYRIEVANSSGSIYEKTINKWDSYDLGNARKFIKLAQTVESAYDGNSSHKDKATTYAYDNTNGNLTQKVEYGEVTGSDDGTFTDTGTDELTINISYASNTGANILGLPSQVTVIDHNANKAKESKYYYDTQSLGSVTAGNLTKREDWKTASTYVNIQKTYSSTYGTLASDTDQRGKTTTYSSDSYNLYPATIINPLSQITSVTYDYTSANVIQKTDPNSRVFQWVYDGLDRVIEEKQPDLATPSTLVTKAAYVYTDTSGSVSVRKTDNLDSSTTRESYQYFDGLGRLIQQRVEAEGTNYEVTDKVYNNRGLLEKESLPYFSSGSARTTPTAASGLYTSYTYDPMQRVVTTVNNLGTTTNTYNDWKLTVTDANSKTKDLYKDAYGNLVQVDEHNSGNTYSTYYVYDYLGDLTKITDALGNVRNFTYDGLGRRLTAQDLHATADTIFGSWTYTYDDAGNLTQKIDPNAQTINYTYDDINRVLTEDYTSQAGTEVTYTYDSGTDGKGRLTGITTGTLTQTNIYNPLGGLKSENKVIDSVTYTTNYDYDRQGNQILITNPDSSLVKYIYNSAGLLNQVQRKESSDGSYTDVISNFDYSPTEQPTTISYANGASTTNTYDSTKLYRLTAKVTTIAGSSHAQDLAYTYDAVGNITQIVDASATDTSKTANYTYDDLYRLTQAAITAVASGQSSYTHNYTYNAIGNILTRTDSAGTYSYAGNTGTRQENPHAATSIGSINYTYDNNGNMLTETSGLSNTWDYNNRLTQAVKSSVTSTYAYDHDGQRVKLANGTTTTYYPTKFYNTDGTTAKKHIFANGMEVAVVNGTGGSAAVRYVSTDHLTGSNIVTNSGNTVDETLDYYPFGSIRIDSGSYNDQRKFAGSEFDADTQLNYLGARYYDSVMGRFTSQDAEFWGVSLEYLVDPQQWNSYNYARNNPLGYIDPDGKKVYAVAKAIEANGAGTHVFLLIVPDNPGDFGVRAGEGWTLGGYAGDKGNLIKARNAPADVSVVQNGYSVPDQKLGKLKDRVEVGATGNPSDTQFIKNITAQYDSYKEDAAYDAFAGNGYNSNNFVTSMLKNAGVEKLPWNGNAPGIDPGYGQAIPSNYIKADGKNRSQGLSAIAGYGSRETNNKINNAVQGIGNGIKNGATKTWDLIRGK